MKKILTTYCCIAVFSAIIYCFPAYGAFSVPATEGVRDSNDSAIINQETVNAITLKNAMLEFKSLSKQERKARIKEAKVALKEFKAQKDSGTEASTNTLLLVILAILLPPLAVYLHENAINGKFWLSVLLTLLLWVPGIIYALIVVLT
jgi:uncharacterized membrane protein YqaE (UPF0057 family)